MKLPSLNLKQWLGITALVLVVGLGSYASGKYLNPQVKEVEVGQEQIGDNTWVLRTQYQNQRTINQQLENKNEELSQEIEELGKEVETLTNVQAKLDLERDSTGTDTTDSVQLDGNVRDTTAVFTKTFGDSLMEVYSRVTIQNNILDNYLDLTQNRPIDIDIAQTELNDQIYISSTDLSEVDISSITKAKEPSLSRTELAAGGFLLGSLTTTILILTLGK